MALTQTALGQVVSSLETVTLDLPALSRQALEVKQQPLPATLGRQPMPSVQSAMRPFFATAPDAMLADHEAAARQRQNSLQAVFGDLPHLISTADRSDPKLDEVTLEAANWGLPRTQGLATETETPLPPAGALPRTNLLLQEQTSGFNAALPQVSAAGSTWKAEPPTDSATDGMPSLAPVDPTSEQSAAGTAAAEVVESSTDPSDVVTDSKPNGAPAVEAGKSAESENVAGKAVPALNPTEADVDRDVAPGQATQDAPATDAEPTPPVVTPQTRPMSPPPGNVLSLRRPIEQCLQTHLQARLNTSDDSCWSIMHAFLGWGPTTEVLIGGPRGQRANAIRWLAQNQACGGRRLFYLEQDHLRGREGPGYQGHPAQFLAMLAQCNIDPNLPMLVGGRNFTVKELILEEQMTCAADAELTFKLIGLTHYLGTDAAWTNPQGVAWTMERVLQLEMAQPVNGAACGGTHRLMAISFAVQARRRTGHTLTGTWARAEKYIADYHRYAYSLQNSDGSFSSDWFKRRADRGDLDRRIQTTGHILEWLVFSLPDESLYDPQVVRAVNFLATSLIQHRYHEWEVGPKCHAIRALRLYHQRVFAAQMTPAGPVARRAPGRGGGR